MSLYGAKKSLRWVLLFNLALSAASLWAQAQQPATQIAQPARNHYRQARELQRQEKDELALAEIRKALELSPRYVEAHRLYVDLQLGLTGNVPDLLREYREKMQQEPDNPVYPLVLADTGHLASDRKEREQLYSRAAELAPEWSWGQYALGTLYQHFRSNPAKAVEAFRKAIELEPDNIQFYESLSGALQQTGAEEEAAAILKRMLEIDPDNLNPYYSLWSKRISQSDTPETLSAVERELESLLQSRKPSPELLSLAARAYSQLIKDDEKAEAQRARIKQEFPDWSLPSGILTMMTGSDTGAPRRYLLGGKRVRLRQRINEAANKGTTPVERARALEEGLREVAQDDLKLLLYQQLFTIHSASVRNVSMS